MSFWDLNWIFLAVAALVVLIAVVLGRYRFRHAAGTGVAVVVLWVLTAVFDNLMIAVGLFDYGTHALSGTRVGLAPLEDFAYPLGAALLLPALWVLLARRADR